MGRDEAGGRRRWPWFLGGGLLAALVIVVVAAVLAFQATSRPLPEFASLADQPDPSLEGTVAYYDGATACVRIVDASGADARDVYCLDPAPSDTGRVTGPHLAWRPDGRLEVTAFSWPTDGSPSGAWQRLVDVETGAVEDVDGSEVPDQPEASPVPAVGPDGQELVAEVRGDRLVIELTTDGATRTLLESEKGPSSSYAVDNGGQPVWSPNGEYVVLFDGRLLLTTVGEPSQTRILVDYPGSDGFGCCWSSGEIRRFAVTDRTFSGTD